MLHTILIKKRELVKNFGVYVRFIDLEQSERSCKSTLTGLMQNLISIWHSNAWLAACSAISGINPNISTAIFSRLQHELTHMHVTSCHTHVTCMLLHPFRIG